MNRLFACVLVVLLVFSGCSDLTESASEDSQRLVEIDRKFHNGHIEDSLVEATLYVQEYPLSDKGWSLLGWIYLKTGDVEKANECFGQSLAINAQSDNALVGQGAAFRTIGDNVNARKYYLKAIRILPDNAEAYSSLLLVELLEGNDEKAVEYGEKAWALRQDLAAIPANLAVAYHYLGNFSKRDHYYEHAKRLEYPSLEIIKDVFDGKKTIR